MGKGSYGRVIVLNNNNYPEIKFYLKKADSEGGEWSKDISQSHKINYRFPSFKIPHDKEEVLFKLSPNKNLKNQKVKLSLNLMESSLFYEKKSEETTLFSFSMGGSFF